MKTMKNPILLMGTLLLAVSVGGAQTPPKEKQETYSFTFNGDAPEDVAVFTQDDDSVQDSHLSKEERGKLQKELESLTRERAKLDGKMKALRAKLGQRVFIQKSITIGPEGRYLIKPEISKDRLLIDPKIETRIRIDKDLSDQDREKLEKEMKNLKIELRRSLETSPDVLVVPKFEKSFKGSIVIPHGDFFVPGLSADKAWKFDGAKPEEWSAWNQEYSKAMKEWHEQFAKAMQEWQEKHAQMMKQWAERSAKIMKEWSEKRSRLREEKPKEQEKQDAPAKEGEKPSSSRLETGRRAI